MKVGALLMLATGALGRVSVQDAVHSIVDQAQHKHFGPNFQSKPDHMVNTDVHSRALLHLANRDLDEEAREVVEQAWADEHAKAHERALQQSITDVVDVSQMGVTLPTEVCVVNKAIKEVADFVTGICSLDFLGSMGVTGSWEDYLGPYTVPEFTMEDALGKLEELNGKIPETKFAAKKTKIKSLSKGMGRALGAANAICGAAATVSDVTGLINELCLNSMSVTLYGYGLLRAFNWDVICLSLSYGGQLSPSTSTKKSWCEDTGGNPGAAGMTQEAYFQLMFKEEMSGAQTGNVCKWIVTNEGNEYCGFDEKRGNIIEKNLVKNGKCQSFSEMVNKFKTGNDGFTYMTGSDKVAHFRWGTGIALADKAVKCGGEVAMILMPVSFGETYATAYGQMSYLADYFNLDLTQINVNAPDWSQAQNGVSRPSETCTEMFIVDTGVDCPTDWFMGDIIITKEFINGSPGSSFAPSHLFHVGLAFVGLFFVW